MTSAMFIGTEREAYITLPSFVAVGSLTSVAVKIINKLSLSCRNELITKCEELQQKMEDSEFLPVKDQRK